jgi:hypothetical protein
MFRCLTLVPLKDCPCKKYVDFFCALGMKKKVHPHLTIQFIQFMLIDRSGRLLSLVMNTNTALLQPAPRPCFF